MIVPQSQVDRRAVFPDRIVDVQIALIQSVRVIRVANDVGLIAPVDRIGRIRHAVDRAGALAGRIGRRRDVLARDEVIDPAIPGLRAAGHRVDRFHG